jgi:peptide/nickel transport system substrate-binding protein
VDHLLRRSLVAQRDRPAQALAAAVLVVAALAGCGGDADGTDPDSSPPTVGGAGLLTYAQPSLPATLDPLAAQDRDDLSVIRQVHEPLVAQLTGPYGDTRRQPGLALSVRPSEGETVWTVTLRSGVRFQDGTPLNAAAVLANARRWRTEGAGPSLLPDLFAVDAPRPDQVRFLLDGPAADLGERLASPRLGLVSPQTLSPTSGEGARYRGDGARSGTGPFQLAGVSPGRVELSRFADWWGSGHGLGPALDGIVFLATPGGPERLSLLEAGTVQVADPLDAAGLAAASANPLLRAVGGPATGLGLAGSVRGLGSARAVPVLSRVWLTDIPD